MLDQHTPDYKPLHLYEHCNVSRYRMLCPFLRTAFTLTAYFLAYLLTYLLTYYSLTYLLHEVESSLRS